MFFVKKRKKKSKLIFVFALQECQNVKYEVKIKPFFHALRERERKTAVMFTKKIQMLRNEMKKTNKKKTLKTGEPNAKPQIAVEYFIAS